MTKEELLDQFNDFEVEVPMLIEDLEQMLAESKDYNKVVLDFTLDTLDKVESFYIDVLNKKEKTRFTQDRLDRVILAYLGDLLIEHAGGHWEMSLEKDFTYGTPMVYGFKHDTDGLGFSPFGIRERVIEDRKKGVFRDSIHFCINKEELENDLMRQMEALAKKKK